MKTLEDYIAISAKRRRGGIDFFTKLETIEILKLCKSLKKELLGIDGFFLTSTTTQPSMDNSIDYSAGSSSHIKNVYKHAIEFITSRPNDMYFEIVWR